MNAENFENQCKFRVQEIYQEISDLRKAAMRDGPLAHEEKLEIRRAMNTLVQCPNGHPYTIGECGVVWIVAAEIGGGGHSLTAGNSVNMEFDSMQS
ncbi:17986_t:CDS:2 [Gigaspora rosea]|nr:17986_t:CDS:2 [Gigaspora rosea]